MKLWCSILCLLWMSSSLSAQTLTQDDLDYLNKEIRFLNESIHRMVIVFQVFENYNSEVTRHVDLPSNEGIKNTSAHLPDNLFADNNLVRRGDSPLDLYGELITDKRKASFPISNWSLMEQAKGVIDFLNQDRKKLDQIIEQEDLEQFSNIQSIYYEIEEALDQYDRFRNTVKIFERLHEDLYHNVELPTSEKQVYTAFVELHFDIKKLVRQLRNENQSGVINSVDKLKKELGWVKTCIAQLESIAQRSDLSSVVLSIEKLVEQIENYIAGVPVPDDYIPFGKGYHYHNYELLPKMNEYGSGYAWKLEEFFKKFNWNVIHFLEEPHYLKVVYPERIPLEVMKSGDISPQQNIRDIGTPKLPELDNIVVNTEEDISLVQRAAETPEVIKKEPPLDIILSELVRTNSDTIFIELFDHYRRDGDRVSISVNGVWIHERISLEEEKTEIELLINAGATNSVIIRADNEGWRPPNTIGIRHKGDGDAAGLFIKKDLAMNQAIELKFQN